jgi:hypothetical protein
MFRDAPLLGQGTNTYVLHYRTYLDALQLPAWITSTGASPWATTSTLNFSEQGMWGSFHSRL